MTKRKRANVSLGQTSSIEMDNSELASCTRSTQFIVHRHYTQPTKSVSKGSDVKVSELFYYDV